MPPGVDRRAARFQQWPGGKPSVATVTELQRKSLCIVTKATTVDGWGVRERRMDGWKEERGGEGRRGMKRKGKMESKNKRMRRRRGEREMGCCYEPGLYYSLHLCLVYAG